MAAARPARGPGTDHEDGVALATACAQDSLRLCPGCLIGVACLIDGDQSLRNTSWQREQRALAVIGVARREEDLETPVRPPTSLGQYRGRRARTACGYRARAVLIMSRQSHWHRGCRNELQGNEPHLQWIWATYLQLELRQARVRVLIHAAQRTPRFREICAAARSNFGANCFL